MNRSKLTTNASALMLSSVATGALGLVYWMVAEQVLPTSEVGRASAVISSATALSSLACLSLGGAYQRFLPISGGRSRSLIVGGFILVGSVALLLGAGFLFFGFGDAILLTRVERATFPLLVGVFALYAITDPILTGLRHAPAVAVKNVVLSVVKIVPLLLITGTGSALAIVGSWNILAAVITAVFAFHAIRITATKRHECSEALPPPREILAFQSTFFMMMVTASVVPLALPLLVVHTTDTTQNAYFNLAWTMCAAAGLLRGAVGSAFIVEASQPDADRGRLLRHLARMLVPVTLVTAAGLAIGGPLVLWVMGSDYLEAAGGLMLVMAAGSVVETVVVTYFLIAQLQRRLRLMLVVQIVMVAVTVGGSVVLLPIFSLLGIGLASLTSSVVALILVAGPMIRGIREMLRPTVIVTEEQPTPAESKR